MAATTCQDLRNELKALRDECVAKSQEKAIIDESLASCSDDQNAEGLLRRKLLLKKRNVLEADYEIRLTRIQRLRDQLDVFDLTAQKRPISASQVEVVNQVGRGKKAKTITHDNAYKPTVGQNVDIVAADSAFSKAVLKNIDDIIFDGRSLSHFFACSEILLTESDSRKTKTLEIIGQLINFDDTRDPDGLLKLVLTTVLKMLPCDKEDLLGFQLWGDEMEDPFFIPNRPPPQNNSTVLLTEFNKLSQSARLLKLFHTALRFKVQVAQRFLVKGRASDDNKCLYVAVAEGLEHLFQDGDPSCESYAELWRVACGVEKDGYDLDDVADLQNIIQERQIRIVVLNSSNKVIYRGDRKNRELFLQLKFDETLQNDHYTFVPCPTKLFNKRVRGFCADCNIPIMREPHRSTCVATCPRCKRFGPEFPCPRTTDFTPLKCDDCGITFFSQACFDAHAATTSKKKRSVCSLYRYCHICKRGVALRGGRTHRCFKTNKECPICHLQHPRNSKFCYVQPLAIKDEQPRTVYCFFDAETMQETGRHICNVIVAEFLCLVCVEKGVEPTDHDKPDGCYCNGVHKGRQVFTSFDGDNPVSLFLAYLTRRPLQGVKRYKLLTIAHNGGKFDFHIILRELLCQNVKPKVTMQGLKMFNLTIDYQSYQEVVFKDSVNFLRERLAGLPKTFGFEADAKKAFFPHKFNTLANLDVRRDTLPEIEYYGPDTMKPSDRKELIAWHADNINTSFCLREDLITYCQLDVLVLRKACLIFRQASLALTRSDPFIVAGTLPKFALHTYRTNHLRLDVLGHTPEKGYRKREIQSEMALRFMRCYAEKHKVTIRTAEWSAEEYKVPGTNYRVDGLIYDDDGNIDRALEFNGCFYHGCPVCYKDYDRLVDEKTALELRLRDEQRLYEIRKQLKVEVVWQCQFEKEMAADAKIKQTFQSCIIPPRLELRRDVLRGGNTQAFSYYYVPKEGERIRAADFVSMYPDVMKNGSYPLEHPKVFTSEVFKDNATKVFDYEGFALVKVIPPHELDPVFLQCRTKDKRLVFGLCAACAEGYIVKCDHTDEERGWVSGYTIMELKKAVELGYIIKETFEVWHYDRWSKKGQEPGLFDGFVDTFAGEKIKNSGWGMITTLEDKLRFVAECEKETGVKIDVNDIVDNAGKRYCAKIMLNSLWGKLCQRNDLSKVIFTHTPEEFQSVMFDKRYEVTDYCHVSEKIDRICVRYKPDMAPETPYTSLAVACYVTAYGRMKLYDVLASIPGRLLYCDTDSVYYVERDTDTPLQTGRHLGALSVEYEGRVITKFVAGGPKNYGIKHTALDGSDEKAVLKVRGFQLNYQASKILVFDDVEKAIIQQAQDGEPFEGLEIPYSLITRNKHGDLNNKNIVKVYRPVYNKSICVDNGLIVPFGSIKE